MGALSWQQVWAWLQTPHAVWWIYGGEVVVLLLIVLVTRIIVKKSVTS
jgi:hypothetical protein